MSLASMLIHTVNIETMTETKSSQGFPSSSWATSASDVKARVMQSSSDATLAYGRLGLAVSHRVYMDSDQSLTIKDRIVFDGSNYEVKAINNAGGHLDRLWQIDCELKPTE